MKMRLSTTTHALHEVGGDEYAIRNLAKIGFDAMDFSFFVYNGNNNPLKYSEKEMSSYFGSLYSVCRECGIAVGQTHAPMPTYAHGGDNNEYLFNLMVASIYASAYLGSPYCVIHPPIMPERRYDELKAENLEICYDIYGRLLPHLEKTGVKLAVENMFNRDPKINKICPTICSTSDEMAEIVDHMGEYFVNCLDIGHTNLTGQAPEDMIKKLGARLQTLHVHDNDGVSDKHTIPYVGKINWEAVCTALKDTGYSGTFSFEADEFVRPFPGELRVEAEKQLFQTGKYLINTYIDK